MDRRIQKTKAAVFAAFETLLLQKSYDKITIQELIDKANIGRSTFYAHFETKDDLLRGMCGDLFDHIFSTQLKAEETHDFFRGARKDEVQADAYPLSSQGRRTAAQPDFFLREQRTVLAVLSRAFRRAGGRVHMPGPPPQKPRSSAGLSGQSHLFKLYRNGQVVV